MGVHEILLEKYDAIHEKGSPLYLGTKESYGVESLHIMLGEGWQDMTITAVFNGSTSTEVVMDENNMVQVPHEVTAEKRVFPNAGKLVFSGVKSGARRISANLLYYVVDHAPADGEGPAEPTPDKWEQYVAYVATKLDKKVGEENAGKVMVVNGSGEIVPGEVHGSGESSFITDNTLVLKDGVLGVNTAKTVEKDNTLPVTSGAVEVVVGNIGAILDTI